MAEYQHFSFRSLEPPGAASGTRTHDLFVTNEMLYQLSYCGNCVVFGCKVNAFFLTGKIFPEFFAQEVGEVLFIVGLRGCRGGMGGAYAGTQTGSHFLFGCVVAGLPESGAVYL